jgi:hypothetical protein
MDNLPRFFFSLQLNIKMYHWQTTSYARHKATDKLLSSLDGLIDKFIEIYQGKFGKFPQGLTTINVRTLNDENTASDFLQQCIHFLNNIVDEDNNLTINDTDLLNIRDEMVGTINQTLYLFSFN